MRQECFNDNRVVQWRADQETREVFYNQLSIASICLGPFMWRPKLCYNNLVMIWIIATVRAVKEYQVFQLRTAPALPLTLQEANKLQAAAKDAEVFLAAVLSALPMLLGIAALPRPQWRWLSDIPIICPCNKHLRSFCEKNSMSFCRVC